MKSTILKIIKKVYVFIFARRRFFTFNNFLYGLNLNSLGVLNYESKRVSGEDHFIKHLKINRKLLTGIIVDVGANQGDYSMMLIDNKIELPIFAFEPNPSTFKKLELNSNKFGFTAIPMGLGEKIEDVKIYDYVSGSGSEHASIYQDVIEKIHQHESRAIDIKLTTLDTFVEENKITKIALLKIDTEGNEKNVLKGAERALSANIIDVIQIEFNEMNVVSRTFMKDFVDMLPAFEFYRLLPDGLLPLGPYNAVKYEIFAFQNIIAIKT